MRGLYSSSGKWWPGAIPLVILWAVAAWTTMPAVEAELTVRAAAALKDTILDKTKITAAGRDITLVAEAFSEEGRRAAVSAVEAVPGIRLVNDRTKLVPEASPYVWSIERDVVRVTLSGSAPLPASRSRLFDGAKVAFAGVEVVDHMALARGAPQRFDAAAMLLIDQLAKLKQGKITLSGTSVALKGMAKDLGGREAIAAALRNLPEGYTVGDNEIEAPPYVFRAYKDPVAGQVTLEGYVPDNAVHAALAAATGRKFFGDKVVDNLKASIGAPKGFVDAAVPALGALSRLSTGTLVLSDREVHLSGDAFYDVAANQIRGGLNKELPQGWKVRIDLSVKPQAAPVDATVCQQLFNGLLAKGTVQFDSASATIDKDSASLLDRLIETAMRCPSAKIEVAGHTDSDGDAAFNQTLSERRARAVVDYMVRAGLPPERFEAFGYGSKIPIAENDTEAGKAKNRRIDFVVR
ncbi:OmpA family protein [Rhodopseudomonas palustris]|uniref:OmpA family protein n=1 Tax=Rhodopseudomonas palustris TaxID=1076 RepID=A0A323UK92_RHOPL|nr:OmpA family protein [Rhodopseudomonas palustris]PZA11366.1 OmpA family protein [Rhodopseudomonas palustris]